MAEPGRIDGRITETHGVAAAGLGGAGDSEQPDPTFVFGGTRDDDGNPVSAGFAGTHPVAPPPPFDPGAEPDDLDGEPFTAPVDYPFLNDAVTIPKALAEAITIVATAVADAASSTTLAVAIPYVTFDGDDDTDAPIVLDDAGLADAWVTDYSWLITNMLVHEDSSTDVNNAANALGLGAQESGTWGYIGKVEQGGRTILVFTSRPGVFLTDALARDEGASTDVFDTGTWTFTAPAVGDPWSSFNNTNVLIGDSSSPTPPHGALQFEGVFDGSTVTTEQWANLAGRFGQSIIINRYDRNGTDFAEFVTDTADPTDLVHIPIGSSLYDLGQSSLMRITDPVTGSWVQGNVDGSFVTLINGDDGRMQGATVYMDVEDTHFSGQPADGAHVRITWIGKA